MDLSRQSYLEICQKDLLTNGGHLVYREFMKALDSCLLDMDHPATESFISNCLLKATTILTSQSIFATEEEKKHLTRDCLERVLKYGVICLQLTYFSEENTTLHLTTLLVLLSRCIYGYARCNVYMHPCFSSLNKFIFHRAHFQNLLNTYI